jgi:adenylate cyclase
MSDDHPGVPTTLKTTIFGRIATADMAWLRISSGLVLFIYVALHLGNHALGLVSDQSMRDAAGLMKTLVRNWPISIILYTSLAVHVLLAFWRIYQRRSLKMSVKEWGQMAMGLAIPYFLISHVIGTRYASAAYGLNDTYDYVLLSVFVFSPSLAVYNALGLVAAWLHGCIGLHMWFRHMAWYSARVRSLLLVAATLLPTLSLTGYLAAGQRIIPLAGDGEFMEEYYAGLNLVDEVVWGWLARDISWVERFILALVGLVILARLFRRLMLKRSNNITIDYVDGPSLSMPAGPTLLDISKLGDVPHANVCGGKGRCSTCRVRILTANPEVNPPGEAEQKVLQRVRASEDVRLACQTYPQGDLKILRLLPSDADRARTSDFEPWSSGREKTVTVMFADLRDFTKTSESRLPFDVVYLINQFSKAMGQVVEQHDGRIDKFLGDGFMALFGVEKQSRNSAGNAINAAGEMIAELHRLNEQLAGDLAEPLRMGIGIHTGSVILGNMGYGHARGLTAIGDTVNTASRLESATKEQKCVLCVSAATMSLAQLQAPDDTKKRIAVRGKKDKLDIHALMDIDRLVKKKEKAIT